MSYAVLLILEGMYRVDSEMSGKTAARMSSESDFKSWKTQQLEKLSWWWYTAGSAGTI